MNLIWCANRPLVDAVFLRGLQSSLSCGAVVLYTRLRHLA